PMTLKKRWHYRQNTNTVTGLRSSPVTVIPLANLLVASTSAWSASTCRSQCPSRTTPLVVGKRPGLVTSTSTVPTHSNSSPRQRRSPHAGLQVSKKMPASSCRFSKGIHVATGNFDIRRGRVGRYHAQPPQGGQRAVVQHDWSARYRTDRV